MTTEFPPLLHILDYCNILYQTYNSVSVNIHTFQFR